MEAAAAFNQPINAWNMSSVTNPYRGSSRLLACVVSMSGGAIVRYPCRVFTSVRVRGGDIARKEKSGTLTAYYSSHALITDSH